MYPKPKIIIRSHEKYLGKTQCPSVEVESDAGQFECCEDCDLGGYELFVEFQSLFVARIFAWLLKCSETYGDHEIVHRRCSKPLLK